MVGWAFCPAIALAKEDAPPFPKALKGHNNKVQGEALGYRSPHKTKSPNGAKPVGWACGPPFPKVLKGPVSCPSF